MYDTAKDMAHDVDPGAHLSAAAMRAICVRDGAIADRDDHVYRQIIGTSAIFAIMLLALWSFHPAFKISMSPLIIVLAFAIIFMSAIVIAVIYGKFDSELKHESARAEGARVKAVLPGPV